ncbi:plasmid partitioning protein RepB C-terminal domain-containing protein [Phyllobacterium myrsinacearum]|uniref:ParB-like chromosome segregation protein Spo0J n=1 Tax=Phyllobacterium myrsinacearum TaxID=28101 RepID=A0A839EVP2_9HYPH|nr:plasmid partitioning protein RepB C-terminal domain-containing protein [Phyllobacterium myrsinacearum]MBA8882165.1 ParB-like chromosome segregation protein Spo0J [Phyllobacterium myrsinacearum]
MSNEVEIGFDRNIRVLDVSTILLLRKVPESVFLTTKYKRITASIDEIGIVEPLVVARAKADKYILLDGYLRYSALIDRGEKAVRCLIAKDDEAYTYNKRVNRLATIQEHFMIVHALERGVPEARLAKMLDMDVLAIKRRRALLNGICPEVVELFKDKSVNPITFGVLRKMKPLRQIEVAELMIIAGNYTASYAKALLAATRQNDLDKPERPKRIMGLTPEQIARMEREMSSLQSDFKAVEASYGDGVLNLVVASGYVSKLIKNVEIQRYLSVHHSELLTEFQTIVASSSLDQSSE